MDLSVGEEGCEEAIMRAWCGGGEDDILDRLRRCEEELLAWKGLSIGKIMRDVAKKRKRLVVLNEGVRSEARVKDRNQLVKEIAMPLKQEELFWRQRSRSIWLREGDRNTKFFHRKATQRREKNMILKLIDDEGRCR
ncbi:uncharacterized protein LOC141595328 [Silene latifolia]|uniref:uncharacterized protein LOC141595328 n=1 Tax=Silene latifolia TaxID=37657 RepID=UPI003D778B31